MKTNHVICKEEQQNNDEYIYIYIRRPLVGHQAEKHIDRNTHLPSDVKWSSSCEVWECSTAYSLKAVSLYPVAL